ncbi:MAG: hypothetical protein EA411_01190 [Saprospirales bacterium]|nr:MAG: hypothetical protein EA411_01190 [Saprospirales bacterium]
MKQLLVALFILCYFTGNCQNTKLEQQRELTKGVYLNFGYHQTDFLNSKYRENLQNDDLSRDLGYHVGLTYQYYPLIFDITFFRSNFSTENLPNQYYGKSTKIWHTGIELAGCLNLLPDVPILNPHIGIGYQWSFLRTPSKDNDKPEIKKVSQVGTSSPIWIVGLNLQFSRSIAINGRYKASLLSDKDNYQLALGILFTLNFSKY